MCSQFWSIQCNIRSVTGLSTARTPIIPALICIDGLTSIPLNGGSLVILANDLLLHKVIYPAEHFLTLQEDVDSLANWITVHHLTLNVRKCTCVKKPLSPQWSVSNGFWTGSWKGWVLQVLGSGHQLHQDLNLKWPYFKSLFKSTITVGSALYRQFYGDSNISTLKALYITPVRPHLEYAIPIWDPHLSKDIQALEWVQ